jgi:flagellar export protein FliJ
MSQFRLATLLKLRERDRDLASKAVQEVQSAIDKLMEQQREIDASNQSMDGFRKKASHGSINLNQILDAQRYQLVLAAQSSQIAQHQGVLNQELERRQSILVKCQQAVKSLEKLREQREQAAQNHALAKQQERLDEWSSVRHAFERIHESGD